MSKPEDDPVIITLIASNLMGRTVKGRIYDNWPLALAAARQGLQEASHAILRAKEDEARMAWLNKHSAESHHNAETELDEAQFIELLTLDLCKSPRAAHKKAFAHRWWKRLEAEYPQAPSITEKSTWKLGTLSRWKKEFTRIYREGRKKAKQSNLKKLKKASK
jgi:hypothetical protein